MIRVGRDEFLVGTQRKLGPLEKAVGGGHVRIVGAR